MTREQFLKAKSLYEQKELLEMQSRRFEQAILGVKDVLFVSVSSDSGRDTFELPKEFFSPLVKSVRKEFSEKIKSVEKQIEIL